MKKILLSLGVIIAFVMYSAYQRAKGVGDVPIVAPKGISATQVSPSVIPTQLPTDTPAPISSSHNTPTTTPVPQNTPTNTPKPVSGYKDGSYTGDATDAFYGNIQVKATISNGRITNIQFLQYPNDRDRSIEINQQADPLLAQEAIQRQSAQVDIISGATDSSQAFVQSLQSALNKAKS